MKYEDNRRVQIRATKRRSTRTVIGPWISGVLKCEGPQKSHMREFMGSVKGFHLIRFGFFEEESPL